MKLGANHLGQNRCEFTVWAPLAQKVSVKIVAPLERTLTMEPADRGYWRVLAEGVAPGTDYLLCLDDARERPDPASFFQPLGVNGPSQVVDHAAFAWTDRTWRGLPQEEWVIYELHVGAFTTEGSFAAVVPRLAELRELGVTAIELMPVAQFPGTHNWGYDGTCPFAVQNSYGGPQGLKTLVDACHGHGLAVILDVVYNHLGPEGNYLWDFGPYFTDRYHTPWGDAVNFDGPGSDEVRRYFIENALHWFRHYRVDALRLDAVHAIYDFSATPFLRELAERAGDFAEEAGRPFRLIAESDLNDPRLIRPSALGGCGLDAQWNDDFHHALHTLLTGEKSGYYLDFGRAADLAKAFREGFVYSWRYSPYRGRRHGSSSADRPASQFVVCSQNHDQVGNRMLGERLISIAGFEAAKLAAAATIFSPFIPLLFMGEEYGEEAPFLYFASFSDPELVEAVRRGRKEEFAAFDWAEEPPDPQVEETFLRSRIDWRRRREGRNRALLDFYREALRLRRELPALAALDKGGLEAGASEETRVVWLRRRNGDSEVLNLLNFNGVRTTVPFPRREGAWRKVFDSADPRWLGSAPCRPDRIRAGEEVVMPPLSCALYQRAHEKNRASMR